MFYTKVRADRPQGPLSSIGSRVALLMATAALVASTPAVAKYPAEPIELVVSYSAGGVSDLMARSFAHAIEKHIDGKMIVQNRPGAAGIIGTDHVYNAKPDGYSLLLARIAVLAVAPALQKVPYDPDKFTFVGMVATDPYACVTGTRKPYKTLEDLKTAIQDKKGKVTYSSSGVGSLNQFAALRILEALDIGDASKIAIHIPSQGEGPALTSVAGGHIDFFCGNVAPIMPQIKSGTVRGLLVTSEQRLEGMEDVPTVAELGLPQLTDIVGWSAIVGPPNMDKDALTTLSAAMSQVKDDQEWQEFIRKVGSEPNILSPEKTEEYIANQRQLYADIVTRLGMSRK